MFISNFRNDVIELWLQLRTSKTNTDLIIFFKSKHTGEMHHKACRSLVRYEKLHHFWRVANDVSILYTFDIVQPNSRIKTISFTRHFGRPLAAYQQYYLYIHISTHLDATRSLLSHDKYHNTLCPQLVRSAHRHIILIITPD